MTRRIIGLALWGYFGWYLAALLAASIGLPSAVGPAAGLAMAIAAAIDWRRLRGGSPVVATERTEPASS